MQAPRAATVTLCSLRCAQCLGQDLHTGALFIHAGGHLEARGVVLSVRWSCWGARVTGQAEAQRCQWLVAAGAERSSGACIWACSSIATTQQTMPPPSPQCTLQLLLSATGHRRETLARLMAQEQDDQQALRDWVIYPCIGDEPGRNHILGGWQCWDSEAQGLTWTRKATPRRHCPAAPLFPGSAWLWS